MKEEKRKRNRTESAQKKRDIFCLEYIKDFNGTRAAIDSGFEPKHARIEQNRLRREPEVAAKIQQLFSERADVLKIEAHDVLVGHLEVARADLLELFDENGEYLKLSDMPDSVRNAIDTVEFYEASGKIKKLKLYSRFDAWKEIGRHVGYAKEKVITVEHKGEVKISTVDLDERVKQIKGES